VRRRYFKAFAITHFLFIPFLLFAVMHVYYLTVLIFAALVIYTVHVVQRLRSWRLCFGEQIPRVVHVEVRAGFTALTIKWNKVPQPGQFAYLLVPGTASLEAHPFTVSSIDSSSNSFLVFARTEQSWTKKLVALGGTHERAWGVEANSGKACVDDSRFQSFQVRLDGFYGGHGSLHELPVDEVVMFAAGSGVCSFLALLEEWIRMGDSQKRCTVHLVWAARTIDEFHFLGKCLAPAVSPASRLPFTLELYLTRSTDQPRFVKGGAFPATMDWPVPLTTSMPPIELQSQEKRRRILEVVDALGSATCGFIGGYSGFLIAITETTRLQLSMSWQEGGINLCLIIIGTVCGALLWLAVFSRLTSAGESSGAQHSAAGGDAQDEEKCPAEAPSPAYVPVEIHCGRPSARRTLERVHKAARERRQARVAVFVSGPVSLVDDVKKAANEIHWSTFDVHVCSFSF
jgi:hypothetical protein